MALAKKRPEVFVKMLDRFWRLLATGFCFLIFGLGGVLLTLTVVPLSWLMTDASRRERWVKYIIHRCFRLFTAMMEKSGVLTVETRNLDRLEQPGQLVIANHPTLIDVVFLISFMPRADCVVKSSLLKNPFTRGPVKAARYIANDDPEAVIKAAGESFARGNSLIVFPEGTRTQPGEKLRLQRGAANIAIRTGQNLRPVIIDCEPPTLTKNTPWYRVPERRFHMKFRVDEELDISPCLEGKPSVMSRQLTATIKDYFIRETAHHE